MKVYKFDEIDSTNKFLKEKNRENEVEIAIAKKQTMGRGRRGNKWSSQEGAGLFSFTLKKSENISEEEYLKLPLVLGYSLLKTLKGIVDLDYKFKWTNDIYIKEKKLSGILVEKIEDFFIIGIGLNINNCDFEEFENVATSLKKETGKNFDIEKIVLKVIEDFYENFKFFEEGNWNKILKFINEYNFLFGKRIKIKISEKNQTEGLAGDILENGMLEVFEGKEIKKYNIGEIHIMKD